MKNIIFFKMFLVLAVVLFANTFASAAEMDARIESAIVKSYVFKTYLKDDSIKVQSKDGIVTLTGIINNESHRVLAQETAANITDVKKVVNQLTLKDNHPKEKSDGWIALKVKTALLFYKSVNGFKTEVSVKDGIVTLSGEAKSKAQINLAREYAKDVEGVKDVVSNMTVAVDSEKTTIGEKIDNAVDKTKEGVDVVVEESKKVKDTIAEKIDNASITAQVKMALLSNRSTSALKTTIKTIDGTVTVGGSAKSEAEKTLVSKLVNDISGVDKVINNMSVVKP